MLAARTPALCAELLPRGTRDGHEWRVGSLAGEPGRSMAVHLTGTRAGVWADFSTGETGDALDLVAQVLFGGDKGQALRWSRGWLGLDGTNPAALATTRRAVAQRAVGADELGDEEKKAAAFRIYLSAQERILDTPVERYLLGRGIDLRRLGRAPRALRYHPNLYNRESGRKWPAMVAAIADHEGKFVAVHRTWLEVRADGGVTKAPLTDAKMTYGPYRGGMIRLWRGASGKALKDAPAGEAMALSEGIEDGLTAAVAKPELRVGAAVSLSNMGSLVLPPAIGTVIILGQADLQPAARQGLLRAVKHFRGQGRTVKCAWSPKGKDINDLVRAE